MLADAPGYLGDCPSSLTSPNAGYHDIQVMRLMKQKEFDPQWNRHLPEGGVDTDSAGQVKEA